MTVREMYTKAYSTRRAVASVGKIMTWDQWLKMWNETPKHTQISEMALKSFVKRGNYEHVTKWDQKRKALLKKKKIK